MNGSGRFTNFFPSLRFRDSTLRGIGKFRPRVSLSGPLKAGRAHLAQSFHYRVVKTKVPVRPEISSDNRLEAFDSFTQIDADVGDRHHVQATLSVFPRDIEHINVNTFTPREGGRRASVNADTTWLSPIRQSSPRRRFSRRTWRSSVSMSTSTARARGRWCCSPMSTAATSSTISIARRAPSS